MPSFTQVSDPHPDLVLGPLLRYVGEHTATIWVQSAHSCRVTVECDGRSWSAPTFRVHGFHYALVLLEDLPAGSQLPYAVRLDETVVWPLPGSPFPPSRIATLDRARLTRLGFGSCRTSVPHDREGHRGHGVDALRALALDLAAKDQAGWPDLFIFLGDQIYADEEQPAALADFIASRRDITEPPGQEVKDYVEYDYLYGLAWSDPVVRWLLSTVPSTMIFDDHDVRDDWNTSWSWQREIRATSWWQERIVSALASYWVYQHVGNLSPEDLVEDEIWRIIAAAAAEPGELDLTQTLDALADRADKSPSTYRWSYTRDLGESKLVVVDSRAARELHPDRRSMLDADEMAWLDGKIRGDCSNLFIGTSLPFLLPPGLHDFEAINEVMAQHGYGKVAGRAAEQLRRAIDLEHWAAFDQGFVDVFEMVMSTARGERGSAPDAITFLSGDVHNSYVAEVVDVQQYGATSVIVQAVCSPMRNPMPRGLRVAMSLFARGLVRPMRAVAGRSSKVPDPAYPWRVTRGPWFDNNVALLSVQPDGLRMTWVTGDAPDDRPEDITVREVAAVSVRTGRRPGSTGGALGVGSG